MEFNSIHIDSDRSVICLIRRKILLHKIKYVMPIVGNVNIGYWENIIRNKKK